MTATAPAAPAKVYFTNLRTHARESQLDKLKRLIRHAGIEQIDFENKFVAIKIHFGELGNLSFLRPNYARAVADVVKSWAASPFLTDSIRSMWVAARNALEHVDTAYQNSFTPYATGCQIRLPTASRAPTRRSSRSRAASTCTKPRSVRRSWMPIS
ncbi:MAG: DUF362 domain-containing protein [Collinsella sp.]